MSTTIPLAARAALITGSTSGIGLGIARVLAGHGVRLMLNGFGPAEQIAELCQELQAAGSPDVAHHPADLSRPEAVADLVTTTAHRFGSLDILVNNAGIQHVAPVESFAASAWESVLAINLSAVFYTIHQALPGMKARHHGRIINIASVHGLVASPYKAAYVAAKHGVVGLTRVVALETATHGVTCNAICPGWVLTPLVQKQIDALAEQEELDPDAARIRLLREKQPSQTFVTPQQVGELVAYLCSPAADAMTGAALTLDGGWTAQ